MSKVIEATLPLSPENQIKYFKDKSLLFKINISESQITAKQCLMTLSNMQLKTEIGDVSSELLYEYMTGRFVVETTNLSKILANVILGYKYEKMPYEEVKSYFSIENYALFIEKYQEVIIKWCEVLNSIPLYILLQSQGFVDDDLLQEIKNLTTKNEKEIDGIGVNLSQVVSLPEFLNLFLSQENVKDSLMSPYYAHYFDNYIYSGKSLLNFLASADYKSNFIIEALALMKCFSEKKINVLKN